LKPCGENDGEFIEYKVKKVIPSIKSQHSLMLTGRTIESNNSRVLKQKLSPGRTVLVPKLLMKAKKKLSI
jgi:hypothetical protein